MKTAVYTFIVDIVDNCVLLNELEAEDWVCF